MNIYDSLNEMITYIEEHLTEELPYENLCKFLGTNKIAMPTIFSLLTGIPISEYIRNRRLSEAGYDLYNTNNKIIDIALKYQYSNPTAFSRAFEKFHGIKPSQVKNHPDCLKLYVKLSFSTPEQYDNKKMEYSIIQKDELILYGKKCKTTYQEISKDAPKFFKKIYKQYAPIYGDIDYGMTTYEDRFKSNKFEYWVLYKKEVPGFEKYVIPKSKWLQFRVNSQITEEIQDITHKFYLSFLPSCNYTIRPIPELEHYHDDITDFLIPIE